MLIPKDTPAPEQNQTQSSSLLPYNAALHVRVRLVNRSQN